MNETLKSKIEKIAKDALESLNEDEITSYDEENIQKLVQDYIEQYEEVTDDEIGNLLHVVDNILASEEKKLENNKQDLFNSKKRPLEQILKSDIIKREIRYKLTEEELERIGRLSSIKKIKGKELTKTEYYIQLHNKYVFDCAFTDEELEKIKEVAIKRIYEDATEEEVEELKKELEDLCMNDMKDYLYERKHDMLDDPIIL